MVRINRHGRICSLLTNASWIPKLDVAGSIPVSRSMFSITWEELSKVYSDYAVSTAHQQDVVDLSRKPKMIKDLPHRAAEFAIEPIQQRRLGWDNEIVVSFSGRGEQRRQHLVSKKKQSTNGSVARPAVFHIADRPSSGRPASCLGTSANHKPLAAVRIENPRHYSALAHAGPVEKL